VTVALAVGFAGVAGAVGRFVVDGAVQDRSAGAFPFGTSVVNVAGSAVLGLVTGLAWYHGLAHAPRAVVGAGFCGAFTTWSTVSWETVRLGEEGLGLQAALHMLGGVAACLAVAGAALAFTAAV